MQRIETFSSPNNPVVKLVRSLALRKHRDETGLFVAEGTEFAARAVAAGFRIRNLLLESGHESHPEFKSLLNKADDDGARISAVSAGLLARITGKDNPQRLILVAEQRWTSALPAPLSRSDVVLALDRIRDPRNLGAIVRTTAAAGARMLVLVGHCCDPYAAEAVRASAGLLFSVPMMKTTSADFLDLTRDWRGDIVGTDVAAAADFRDPRRGPVLLMMGNESRGLSENLLSACTGRVRIPMTPDVPSLNLAAAAALMLYELRRPYLRVGAHGRGKEKGGPPSRPYRPSH
jgi:TrmH family RNA methyltransferase